MEEIKNFIYSHSSPNGCVALTRSERDELIEMIEKHCKEPRYTENRCEALEEDNIYKQDLINDYVFGNAKLTKENERLSKMLNEAIVFIEQEDMQCKLCSFYLSCRDGDCAYKDEVPTFDVIRAELEKRVDEHKNDNNCPDVMCDDCNKECELKKIMGETNDRRRN